MKRRPKYYLIMPWLLLFIYFLGNTRVVMPYIEYKINYDFISQVLCVNRTNPDLQCQGKCHLAKELKKAAEKDADKKETAYNTVLEVTAAESFFIKFDNVLFQITRAKYFYTSTELLFRSSENTTPPPKA